MAVSGVALADAGPLHLVVGTLSATEGVGGTPAPATTFSPTDHIYFFSQVSWDAVRGAPGQHHLTYKWFTGDALTFSFEGDKDFKSQPFYWAAWVSGGHLGLGRHRAELYVDNQLLDSHEFEIVSGPAVANAVPTPVDEATLDAALKKQGRDLLVSGDTEAFDRLAAKLRQSKARTPAGTWQLSLLYRGIDALAASDPKDPQWQRLEATTANWLTVHPDSAAAVISTANALLQHGWSWRGNGTGNTIKPDNLQSYQALLERASTVLAEHLDAALTDPEGYALRINIANQQGAAKQEILDIASQGLQRFPTYYPIHYAAVDALLPKWGGSEEWVQRYVELALIDSKSEEGTQAYGRIYFNIARHATNPLRELNLSGAKLPTMKQSFDEILRAYPDEFNRDAARGMYCMAGDRPALVALGPRAPTDHSSVAWWDTVEWRGSCDTWKFDSSRQTWADRLADIQSFFQGFGATAWRTVSLVSFALLLLLEGLQTLLMPARNLPAPGWARGLPARQSLDLRLYPSSYWIVPGRNAISLRAATRMLVVGLALAWMLWTVPWDAAPEAGPMFVMFLLVACAGALIAAHRLSQRIVLQVDAIERRGLFARRRVERYNILDCAPEARDDANALELRVVEAATLRVPAVYRMDGAFREWFAGLPRRL